MKNLFIVAKMSSKMGKDLYVEVIIKKRYLFDARINSCWTDVELINSFFKESDINAYHATRDASHIGRGDKLLKIRYKRINNINEISKKEGFKCV